MVKAGGKVALVHRPFRLVDLLGCLRRHRLEPKRIRFVHPRAGDEANMVLLEAIRDGKPELRMLPPLIVYDSQGNYCPELMKIYFREKDRD
jgi:tRNA1(Val) A37 N6-methylase TrmN6